jgi:multisubunit Na+/H+ antiporter MnhG subunit
MVVLCAVILYVCVASLADNGKRRMNKHSNTASLLAFLVLPYQQRLIARATYRQSKYKWQYVHDRTRRRDKTWLLSLAIRLMVVN